MKKINLNEWLLLTIFNIVGMVGFISSFNLIIIKHIINNIDILTFILSIFILAYIFVIAWSDFIYD